MTMPMCIREGCRGKLRSKSRVGTKKNDWVWFCDTCNAKTKQTKILPLIKHNQ